MNLGDIAILLFFSVSVGVIVGLVVVEAYAQWARRKNIREANKFIDKYYKENDDR